MSSVLEGDQPLSQLASVATVMRGRVLGPDRGILSLAMDDLLAERIEHALVARIHGTRGELLAKLKFESRGVWELPDQSVYCLGSRGKSAVIGKRIVLETIAPDLDLPGVVGLIRDGVMDVQGRLRAIALDGRLFARDDSGVWHQEIARDERARLHRIVQGNVKRILLAATVDGGIMVKEGSAWRSLDLPSSQIVNAIWTADGETFLACGLHGLLLRFDLSRASVIEHDFSHENFWSICTAGGRTLVSSLHHLYELGEDGLQRLDPLDAGTFHLLSAQGESIWSMGGKDVLQLTDAGWSRII